jgi:hypothetical protein
MVYLYARGLYKSIVTGASSDSAIGPKSLGRGIPYATAADKRAMFVHHVESLISRENAIWTNVHQQKEEPAGSTDKR